MTKPKIAFLCVPFLWNDAQLAFAIETLDSISSVKLNVDTIAVINGLKDDPFYRDVIFSKINRVELNDRNNLARAWNRGIRRAFERGASHVVVSNLDMIYHRDYFDEVWDFANRYPEAVLWSGCGTGSFDDLDKAAAEAEDVRDAIDFASFVVTPKLFELVGDFDEQFEPAYFEDADMVYRIKLKGLEIKQTTKARFFHYHSHTVTSSEGNAEILSLIDTALKDNSERYIRKWGGPVHGEVFRAPYEKSS